MNISIPEFATIVLIGASGSGKSTFAARHFLHTEVLSSDAYRGIVCDDENDQSSTKQAFELLHHVMGVRLANRRSVVIDATNVQHQARNPLVAIARQYHSMPVAIVLNMPEAVCHERNHARLDRQFGDHVVRNHRRHLKRSLKHLRREGFRYVHVINSVEELEQVSITRAPLWNNKHDMHGPFDIIGDVHGCYDELEALLRELGYTIEHEPGTLEFEVTAPDPSRRVLFVGDLVDRGPKVDEVLALAMTMVEQDLALCVSGNHEAKLLKALEGKKVKVRHGLKESLEQLDARGDAFKARVKAFLNSLISHYMLDDGRLCLAHAGLRADLQGRASGKVRSFALYGETSGEVDAFGLPIRHNWAADYRGDAMVVYGHTPTPTPQWLNNTLCIDTGCVFGGTLTALRYPEREVVSVDALRMYAEPIRPLETASTEPAEHRLLIDIEDVSDKLVLNTSLYGNVIVQKNQTTAALEVMSRFAIHPNWLIYLPPTMSPTPTSRREGYLEYPEEALSDYRSWGVERVICQVKHMGSRAVAVITREDQVAVDVFGQTTPSAGVIYTRTGRAFFKDQETQRALLLRLRAAISKANLWDELNTDWICLDTELMPWSAKAESLLKSQYASVAAAATSGMDATMALLEQTTNRLPDASALRARFTARADVAKKLAAAYRPYCWSVKTLDDYQIAPFHVMASAEGVYTDRDHLWHMEMIARMVDADDTPTLFKTAYRVVSLDDDAACAALYDWWETLTANGDEGLVIKPIDFIARGKRGLLQPAIKCRGQEYLRMIYGPEYTLDANLERLRSRGLSRKRGAALREFALGVEALERFVAGAPLRKVHSNVFGILALESDPIDPRL